MIVVGQLDVWGRSVGSDVKYDVKELPPFNNWQSGDFWGEREGRGGGGGGGSEKLQLHCTP